MMNSKQLIRITLLLLTLVGSSSGLAQTEVSLRQDPKHPTYYYGTWYEGTYCYTVPADVEVWYAYDQSVSGGVIHLEKSTDNIIYNTFGVILRGTTDTVTLSQYGNPHNVDKSSVLTGTGDAAIYPNYTHYDYYVLSYTDAYGVGFYKCSATTIPAHKAYYRVSKGGAPELTVLTFDFGDGTTGIESLTTPLSQEEGAQNVYNLNGQRVSRPTKGVFIVNGRKMVVK